MTTCPAGGAKVRFEPKITDCCNMHQCLLFDAWPKATGLPTKDIEHKRRSKAAALVFLIPVLDL